MASGHSPSLPFLAVAALLCVGSLMIPHAAAAFYEINNIAEVFSPPGPRQSDFPTKLGEPFSYNNDLKIGDDKGALVGFTNGNCLVSAEITEGIENTYYECYETLVFTAREYQGSSVTIVGFYDFVANNPLAIVGGTGLFRGATGELNYILPADSFAYSIPELVFVTPDLGAPPPPTTPAPTTGAPVTTCDPGSSKPNQCFSSNGSSFVCCAGSCGPSSATASCS